MGVSSWKSRLLHVAGLFDEPAVREVLISARGAVMAVRAGGPRRTHPDLTPAQLRALTRSLVSAISLPFGPEHPVVQARLDGFRISLHTTPAVEAGPVIRIEREAGVAPTVSALIATDVLTSSFAELLRRSVGHSSMVIIGARGTGKSALLAALVKEAAARRRVLVCGLSQSLFERGLAAELVWAKDAPLHQLSLTVGAELIVAEQPSGARWLELLAGSRPFVASFEAPDMSAGLSRLLTTLVLERPGLTAEAAETMIEGGLAIIAELGQRAGELSAQLLAFGEPRRVQGRLSLRVLARRKPEGGEEMSLEGSRIRERLASFSGRVSEAPKPSFLPDETRPERAELGVVGSKAQLGVVEAAFAAENQRSSDAPVGRIGSGDLSMLRPEQLVSQSFLVDVSKEPGFGLATNVKTWAPESPGKERASTELSPREPSGLDSLEEIGSGSFSDGDRTLNAVDLEAAGVELPDEFGGVETVPPSVLPGQAPAALPALPDLSKAPRVGQDDGQTLILGAGSATPGAGAEDVVDRRTKSPALGAGPKARS